MAQPIGRKESDMIASHVIWTANVSAVVILRSLHADVSATYLRTPSKTVGMTCGVRCAQTRRELHKQVRHA